MTLLPGPSNRLFGDPNRWFLGTCCHQEAPVGGCWYKLVCLISSMFFGHFPHPHDSPFARRPKLRPAPRVFFRSFRLRLGATEWNRRGQKRVRDRGTQMTDWGDFVRNEGVRRVRLLRAMPEMLRSSRPKTRGHSPHALRVAPVSLDFEPWPEFSAGSAHGFSTCDCT